MSDEPEEFDIPALPDLDGLTDEEKLNVLSTYLDMFPPEIVSEGIRSSGALDVALDTMKELADSDDEEIRKQVRDQIKEMRLGPLLADELPD